MENKPKTKGPLAQRFFIIVLSIVLGILLYWLLNFITDDISKIKGPDRVAIESKHVSKDLISEESQLKASISKIKKDITNLTQNQKIIQESTVSLQNTINQLLKIQSASLQKDVPFPAQSQETLAVSQTKFLENQKEYQKLNSEISTLTLRRQTLEKDLASTVRELQNQREPAQKEYDLLFEKYRFKIAALKLVVLVPILLIAAFLLFKKRTGTYGPLLYAVLLASLLKTTIVMYDYFPEEYFKYIALVVIIGVILLFLVYLLKNIASPKKSSLLKQYQQSYDKGICPICSKPIRFGPTEHLPFKKAKIAFLPCSDQVQKDVPYTCPSCGTGLYEKCGRCDKVKHSLLPYCKHCVSE